MRLFFKKLTTKKKWMFLLLIFLFLPGLIFPLVVKADVLGAAVTSFWSYIDTTLGALDFTESIVINLIGKLLFFLLLSDAFLLISSGLLEWAVNQDISLMNNPLVSSGWHFVLGLTNLFFILVFVFIALSFILKLETFQAKKALPRLIAIALLVNFSLVFVGFFVDISQLFFKGIVKALGGNLFSTVTSYLSNSVVATLGMLGILMAGMIASAFVPLVNIAAQGAILGIVIALEMTLGLLSKSVLMIIINILLGGIFLIYFVLFLMRIAIVWILAILSPFAFLCWVLPQTKKYWDEWFHWLIEWLTLGIFVIFLSLLGLRLFASNILNWGGPLLSGTISNYFKNYLFILVYFGVVLYLSKRYVPQIANTLLSYGTGLAMGAVRFTRPFTKRIGGGVAERIAKSERVQRWAARQAQAEKGWGIVPAGMRRAVGRRLGPSLLEARKAEISQFKREAEKIETPELLYSKYLSATTDAERIAYLSAAIKKGGRFKEVMTKEVDIEKAIAAAAAANRMGVVPEAERIARGFINKLDEEKLKRMGFKSFEELPEEKRAKWQAKGYKTITDSLIGEAKGDEIKDFAKGFWEVPNVAEAIQKFWSGEHLSRAAQEFGREFVSAYNKRVKEMPDAKDWYLKNNPSTLLYLTGNAAQDLGFEPIEGLTRDEVRKLLVERRRPPRSPAPPGIEYGVP
jgi:hypothetical protein